MAAWSYSALKQFLQCPRQYHGMRVTKEFKDDSKSGKDYGTQFHKAAELMVRDGTPLPEEFKYAKNTLLLLKNKPGEKFCEYKMSLTASLQPCDFFDSHVWLRAIADLLIVDGERAYLLDYKTGKSAKYADKGQLELMALCLFKHFPEVEQVNAGLLFVVANTMVKAKYTRNDAVELWKKWLLDYAKLDAAYTHDRWNPRPSGLCKEHCAVVTCPHNWRM